MQQPRKTSKKEQPSKRTHARAPGRAHPRHAHGAPARSWSTATSSAHRLRRPVATSTPRPLHRFPFILDDCVLHRLTRRRSSAHGLCAGAAMPGRQITNTSSSEPEGCHVRGTDAEEGAAATQQQPRVAPGWTHCLSLFCFSRPDPSRDLLSFSLLYKLTRSNSKIPPTV
jgi:hypothetical protein